MMEEDEDKALVEFITNYEKGREEAEMAKRNDNGQKKKKFAILNEISRKHILDLFMFIKVCMIIS